MYAFKWICVELGIRSWIIALWGEMITVALAIQSQASVRQGSSESCDVGSAGREERRWRGQPLPSFVGEN